MAADRTREEQQAINYAFDNNGTWAVLTSFEKLRLFNARRDWLVLSFERPSAYLDEFDLLWLLSYDSVCSGELDRLSDQRHRADVDTDYLALSTSGASAWPATSWPARPTTRGAFCRWPC